MSSSGSSPAPPALFCSSGTKGALCALARAGVDAGLRAADMELTLLVWAGPRGARRAGGFVRA
eukprot:2629700-Lingulodinium_polyedra.AAC.1